MNQIAPINCYQPFFAQVDTFRDKVQDVATAAFAAIKKACQFAWDLTKFSIAPLSALLTVQALVFSSTLPLFAKVSFLFASIVGSCSLFFFGTELTEAFDAYAQSARKEGLEIRDMQRQLIASLDESSATMKRLGDGVKTICRAQKLTLILSLKLMQFFPRDDDFFCNRGYEAKERIARHERDQQAIANLRSFQNIIDDIEAFCAHYGSYDERISTLRNELMEALGGYPFLEPKTYSISTVRDVMQKRDENHQKVMTLYRRIIATSKELVDEGNELFRTMGIS